MVFEWLRPGDAGRTSVTASQGVRQPTQPAAAALQPPTTPLSVSSPSKPLSELPASSQSRPSQLLSGESAVLAPSPPRQTPNYPTAYSWFFNERSLRQVGLFFAGATFFLVSTRITQRQLLRRNFATFPAYFRPSNGPPREPISGPFEAFEALSLATINTCSMFMMIAGGCLWAFDISSLTDLRRKIRGGLGVDGTGRSTKQIEDEFEEWLAATLERRRQKSDAERDEEDKGVRRAVETDEDVKAAWRNERGQRR